MTADSTVQPTDVAGRIVLIDSDVDLVQAIDEALAQRGYRVFTATDWDAGVQQVLDERPDLVIVDVGADGSGSAEICQRVRGATEAPMLVLATQGGEELIMQGLESGAKDYLTKPFEVGQLVTRAQILLRRASLKPARKAPTVYGDDYLAVNLADHRILVEGRLVQLTPTEYRLLGYLLENAGRVLTYEQLLEQVWGRDYVDYVDYVRIYVWRLRKKIERDPRQPQYILTEHGIGYRFEKAV
jgi:two-component system KDP operon response regulator KdpE